MNKDQKQFFLKYLDDMFPNAKCELNFSTPFQLLVAVVLSAQCTDKRVNLITPILFKQFKTPYDFAVAKIEVIEEIIKLCVLYKKKTKNIVLLSKQLIEKYGGTVPNNLKDLTSLSGVGMKTAKVVLNNVYGAKVIAVDTHILRVSNRLGIVDEKNPDKCSIKLEKIFKQNIGNLHHKMVLFGRYFCKARNPDCNICKLKDFCKYYKKLDKQYKMWYNTHKGKIMFLDRVKITIKAGNGGNGAVSFYRSKLTMNGGPDGGDGGKGGSVIFVANEGINTLYGFSFKKKFVATDGLKGEKQHKKGADGKDVIIEVPCGTVILDAESEKVIADLTNNGDKFVALKGGNGGHGNEYYKTPTRQAPHFSQTGEVVKERQVILELKTIADVGLVGYPNVGKSTLLSVISNANPKIANYHFTTIYPNLGVVSYKGNSFVACDIPGLIDGASEGAGLGHYFLKHVERVRVIVHLVDISECEGRDSVEDYFKINDELKKYSQKLALVPQIVALTKIDLLSEEQLNEKVKKFKEKTKQEPILLCSIIHKGIDELKSKIWQVLEKTPKPAPLDVELTNFDERDKSSFDVKKIDNSTYEVFGGLIDNMVRGIVLSDDMSFAYFQSALKKFGIIDKLKEKGLKIGDTVIIKDISFEYEE